METAIGQERLGAGNNNKGPRVLREKPQVKYAFMSNGQGEFSISAQCDAFGVSRSGYYAWRHRQANPSQRQLAREALDHLVAEAFETKKGIGSPLRLTLDLDDQGHSYNRKTVAASMKRQGLVAKAGRKHKATTDSDHNLSVAPNLLKQDFRADAPNQKWVCDISYLWSGQGWLYLAAVFDLFSRMVAGWAMEKRMKADLVCDALQIWLCGADGCLGALLFTLIAAASTAPENIRLFLPSMT